MTKGDELCRLFRCLNSGDPCGREDIAFGDLIRCDQVKRFPLEANVPPCNCSAPCKRLRRDINHLCPAISVNVSELFHFSSLQAE